MRQPKPKGKRGNPAWVKGKSGNPRGRPRVENSLAVLYQDPDWFIIGKHPRWHSFCFGLIYPPFTGAAAARKAGYSPKSARYIASRLRRKPVIREILRRVRERCDKTIKLSPGVYMIPDYSGHYHRFEDHDAERRAREWVEMQMAKRR